MPDLSMPGGYTLNKNLQMFSFKHPHQTIKINMDIPTIKIAISTKIYNSIKLLRATSNLRNLKSANSSIII